MSETDPSVETPAPSSAPTMPYLQRAVAIFVRPSQAWSGLEARSQWWFPTVVMLVCSGAWTAVMFPRAIAPMSIENMEAQVASGQMPPESLEAAQRMMLSPLGIGIGVVFQMLTMLVLLLVAAALIQFCVSFIIGVRFRFRMALEVTAWSWLTSLPSLLAVGALAWMKESLRGVHVGFGALLPEPETPSKLMHGLAAFLDSLGPLSLWPLVVTVLGVVALTGAARRSVAWVLGSLFLVLMMVQAVVGALNTPA